MHMPFGSAIPVLGIYLRAWFTHVRINTNIITEIILINLRHLHTMKYYTYYWKKEQGAE